LPLYFIYGLPDVLINKYLFIYLLIYLDVSISIRDLRQKILVQFFFRFLPRYDATWQEIGRMCGSVCSCPRPSVHRTLSLLPDVSLLQLHWLPVRRRVQQFKLRCLMHSIFDLWEVPGLSGQHSESRRLRSSSSRSPFFVVDRLLTAMVTHQVRRSRLCVYQPSLAACNTPPELLLAVTDPELLRKQLKTQFQFGF